LSNPAIGPQTAKMKLSATCPGHARTDVSVGDHEIITDEPESRGGSNLAAAPVQTFMASLIGCTNVITNKCARDLGVEINSMEIEMEAEIDRRGMMLTDAVAVPFPAITLNIDVKTNATDEQWDQVIDYLHKFCPIAVVIRASGTTITENWNLIRD
jgi:putative redox protein